MAQLSHACPLRSSKIHCCWFHIPLQQQCSTSRQAIADVVNWIEQMVQCDRETH
ncbi:MAG TPA: hypothetical protein V6C85_38145 [Allocoleopsis sp.]